VLRLLCGPADRDPARWDDPDVFDITRPTKKNLGSGDGMHTCLGANLARLELEYFLNRLLDDIPELTLAEPPDYGGTFMVRGPERVVVAVG
jgi:cytochrome P450